MTEPETEQALRIQAFRESISANLLAKHDFIDWDVIESRVASAADQICSIKASLRTCSVDEESLTQLLHEDPATYSLLLDLIAFNTSGAQVEKWGLPPNVNNNSSRTRWVAGQLLHIGLGKLLTDPNSVEAQIKQAEVFKDSFRRRFRSAGRLEQRTNSIIRASLEAANNSNTHEVRINANALTDPQLRRSLTHVLAVGNRPVAGIATVFQNQSGGRQQRDLSVTYPNLQSRLESLGMSLILLADGQGLKEASDRTLRALFDGVRYPMTLNLAQSGELAKAVAESSELSVRETVDQTALNELISRGLIARLEVKAVDLPVSIDQGRLALAYFAESRRTNALQLGDDGSSITWNNREWIERARALKSSFDPPSALNLFSEMLGLEQQTANSSSALDSVEYSAPPVQPFADVLHVSAGSQPLTSNNARKIGQRSMEVAPGSPMAVYLTTLPLAEHELQAHRKAQIFLPTNIIIISPTILEAMARHRRPLERFMDALLVQADLTKVSPYVLNNATPERMFYGRESEAAIVLQTITTNSVAILGSRRIGKTSLIRRLQNELNDARFQPFFGDCQTVRTWADFADLARRNWNADLPDDFRPNHLINLVEQLSQQGEGQVIIILDEIDQLLDWDQEYAQDSVPEAFFRACRSLSQEGSAHFVFSGERRIANRLWDPESPHWNFCREVALTQLDRSDAISLLVDPLTAMNIEIVDASDFEDEVWLRTSGHPQIVQFLGDRLVRSLDERSDRRNLQLGTSDLVAVTETFEYAEHYLNTYWGQATAYEKSVSRAVASGNDTSANVLKKLSNDHGQSRPDELFNALRMLQLYGIVEEREGQLQMRAKWFARALQHFNA